MLERSAGKLARSVLRGLGEREPTWLPGDTLWSKGEENHYYTAEINGYALQGHEG